MRWEKTGENRLAKNSNVADFEKRGIITHTCSPFVLLEEQTKPIQSNK